MVYTSSDPNRSRLFGRHTVRVRSLAAVSQLGVTSETDRAPACDMLYVHFYGCVLLSGGDYSTHSVGATTVLGCSVANRPTSAWTCPAYSNQPSCNSVLELCPSPGGGAASMVRSPGRQHVGLELKSHMCHLFRTWRTRMQLQCE